MSSSLLMAQSSSLAVERYCISLSLAIITMLSSLRCCVIHLWIFSHLLQSSEILCWDIRNPGSLLCAYSREVSTSQRIYFDLDMQQNRYLVSGGKKIYYWCYQSFLESV